MLLSPRIAESGPGGMRVIEGLGEFPQGLLARGPAQQAKPAKLPDRVIKTRAGAFDGLVRLTDLPPARPASGRVGRGRVRPDRVQHHLLDPVGLDRRSPLASGSRSYRRSGSCHCRS